MIRRRSARVRWSGVRLGVAACLALALAPCDALEAQSARRAAVTPSQQALPFAPQDFDPVSFIDRLMGAPRPEDQAALEKIEVSLREEREAGKQAADAFIRDLQRQRIRVLERGAEVKYLQALVETLRPQMEHADRYPDIKIYLADSPRTDARSFPGGTLVFFRGLLDLADSEAALVGVIGHELSHIDHGHQLSQVRTLKLAQQTFASAGREFSPEKMFAAGGMMARMWSKPFRPEDEATADRDGATWAYRAGYDPRLLAALFLKLHRRDQGKQPKVPSFLRTHPFHMDRYQAVLDTYAELAQKEPRADLVVGRENLLRRIPASQRKFAD